MGTVQDASGERVLEGRVLQKPIPLVNAIESPFGAGWEIAGLRRLVIEPDGNVLMTQGGDAPKIYYPHINYARLPEGASILGTSVPGEIGDPRNMLGYAGPGLLTPSTVGRVDLQYGFRFQAHPDEWDWVIMDLGQERDIHTLGLSFASSEPSDPIAATSPFIQIYTSLDQATWSLWSETPLLRIVNGAGTRLTSPYTASRQTPLTVRYIKYQMRSSGSWGSTTGGTIYRLHAFGPSDRYGNGQIGEDEDYPWLRLLDTGAYEQRDMDGTIYHYSAKGLPETLSDTYGNTTTFTWDQGLLRELKDPAGGITHLNYSQGKLSEVEDSAGRRTSFVVDTNGDLTDVTLPDGSKDTFAYDPRHLVVSHTDARDNQTQYAWDSTYPRLTHVRKPSGGEVTLQSGSFDYLLNGVNGTFEHPADPIRMDGPNGHGTSHTVTDELGRTTTYTTLPVAMDSTLATSYRITDPLGRVTYMFTHPQREDVTPLMVLPDNTSVQVALDAMQPWHVAKVVATGDSSAYSYEPEFGHIATFTDYGGHTTTYTYNPKGSLESVTDPMGNVTRMEYDNRGLLTTLTDAENCVRRFGYDTRGNLTSATDPTSRVMQFERDQVGNVTQVTSPGSHTTRSVYDVMSRVTEVTEPDGGLTRYTYSECGGCSGGGLLTSITDAASRTTRFEYDQLGRQIATENPLGLRRERTYDLLGRLTASTNNRGQAITYEYDLADRLIKKTLPDEGAVEYSYNVNDRLTRVADSDSLLQYEYTGTSGYDPSGHLHKVGSLKKETVGNATDPRYVNQAARSVNFWYVDPESHLPPVPELPGGYSITYGNTVIEDYTDYVYDHAHRLTAIKTGGGSTPWNTMTLDRLGRRKTMSVRYQTNFVNPQIHTTMNTTYQWDAAGRLVNLSYAVPNSVWSRNFTYTYDPDGLVAQMQDSRSEYFETNTVIHRYGYDQAGQLIAADHGSEQPQESFSYDSVGNRTHSHISSSYSYDDANRLLADDQFQYGYDADGNLTSKVNKLTGERHEYVFCSENRMTAYRKYDASGALVTQASYFYDGVGRRMSKQVNGVLTRWVYVGEDIAVEINAAGYLARRYLHGPGIDEPLVALRCCLSNGEMPSTYYATDALGSVKDMKGQYATDGANPITYDSFGQMIAAPTGYTDIYRYTSRETDAESGLYFYRARLYDPHAGRFVSEDPIGFAGGGNLYRYAGSDPVNHADPTGTSWFGQHFVEGFLTGLATNEGLIGSLEMGWGVMMADFRPGAQLPMNARQHAMAIPGQTREQAEEAWRRYIEDSMNSGDVYGALHAMEDKSCPAHRFKTWNGKMWSWRFLFVHLPEDFLPNDAGITNGIDMINEQKRREQAINIPPSYLDPPEGAWWLTWP